MSEKVKVGEGVWAIRGHHLRDAVRWVIIGAPNLSGKRWLTAAPEVGGDVVSYPEDRFHQEFRRVD